MSRPDRDRPITGLCVVSSPRSCPAGYEVVSRIFQPLYSIFMSKIPGICCSRTMDLYDRSCCANDGSIVCPDIDRGVRTIALHTIRILYGQNVYTFTSEIKDYYYCYESISKLVCTN